MTARQANAVVKNRRGRGKRPPPAPVPDNATPAFQARLRAAIEKTEHASLWVKGDTPPFKPALLRRIHGDGRALFWLTTLNQRPRYYVIQGDSGWDAQDGGDGPDFGEFVDEILTDLEDHFGNARCGYSGNDLSLGKRERTRYCKCDDCSNGSYRARWPMVDADGGCSWGRLEWPQGFDTQPHPHRPGMTLLRAPAARSIGGERPTGDEHASDD